MDEGSEQSGGIAVAKARAAAAAAAAEGRKVDVVSKAVSKLTVYGKVGEDGGWTSDSRGDGDRKGFKRIDKVAKE
jgi:hypothetical protein